MASNSNNNNNDNAEAVPSLADVVAVASDSKSESEWEGTASSPLHDNANHVRGFSNDFVDDEEVELVDDGYESSNSSWLPSSDDELSKLTRELGVPVMENAGVFEPAQTIEWDHLASWVKEHSIFLQAALDLLQERDKHAPTVGMMDPVILKAGPLKRASILMKGIWKVKYVEIRRGMLSYYENLQNEDKLIRKDVPLQAHDCTVRAVKVHPSKAALQLTTNRRGGAIFELVVGNSKKIWMASSRDERQSWMQAIRNATVGGSLTTSNDHSDHRGRLRVVNPRSPYRHDLRLYLKTQSILRAATNQMEYIQGLTQLSKERSSLLIPVKWIAKEQELLLQQQLQQSQVQFTNLVGVGETTQADGQQAFNEEEVDRSIEQLWKDLQRDSVAINGKVYRGDQGLGPQGIMGALAQSILQVSLTPAPSTMVISPPAPPLSPSPAPDLKKLTKTPDDEARKSFTNIFKSDDDNRRSFAKRSTEDDLRKFSTKRAVGGDDEIRRSLTKGSDDNSLPEVDSPSAKTPGGPDSAPDSPACAYRNLPLQTPLTPSRPRTSLEVATRWSDFSEAQALTYARDILLSGNRTRSGGDSYFCINTLLQNPELVVVVPSYGEVDPVKFFVTPDEAAIRRNDKAGWIKCRSKLQRSWKKLFCVLSEGILSCYERALPRPNGLRGQLNMTDAVVNVSRKESKVKQDKTGEKKARFICAVSISTKDGKERTLAFDSVDRMLDWVYALECMAKANKTGGAGDSTTRRLIRRRSSESSSDQIPAGPAAEQATENHAAALGMDLEKVRERLANLSRKASPSVRVSVEASTEYKVSTTDPQGQDSQDTWAVVRTSFQQSFRLTGGPGGRIMRGEEVVRVVIVRCQTEENVQQEVNEPQISPRRKKKNLFRSFSANDDGPPPLEDLNASKTNIMET